MFMAGIKLNNLDKTNILTTLGLILYYINITKLKCRHKIDTN